MPKKEVKFLAFCSRAFVLVPFRTLQTLFSRHYSIMKLYSWPEKFLQAIVTKQVFQITRCNNATSRGRSKKNSARCCSMIHVIDGSPVKMGRQMFGLIACTCVRVCNGCHDGNNKLRYSLFVRWWLLTWLHWIVFFYTSQAKFRWTNTKHVNIWGFLMKIKARRPFFLKKKKKGHDGQKEKRALQLLPWKAEIFEGHHDQLEGHRRPWPTWPPCNSRPVGLPADPVCDAPSRTGKLRYFKLPQNVNFFTDFDRLKVTWK